MEINYKDYDRMSIIQIVKIFLKELDEAVLPPTYLSSKTSNIALMQLHLHTLVRQRVHEETHCKFACTKQEDSDAPSSIH